MKMKRKAQEEMIGFVLIVVIIVIAGVILLGFSLRQPIQKGKSLEISNFLEASSLKTTDCAINFIPQYDNLEDLIVSCHNNKVCLNNELACDVLKRELTALLHDSFPINQDSKYIGYNLEIYYSTNSSQPIEILTISEGNCTKGQGADKFINDYPGIITEFLEVCFRD